MRARNPSSCIFLPSFCKCGLSPSPAGGRASRPIEEERETMFFQDQAPMPPMPPHQPQFMAGAPPAAAAQPTVEALLAVCVPGRPMSCSWEILGETRAAMVDRIEMASDGGSWSEPAIVSRETNMAAGPCGLTLCNPMLPNLQCQRCSSLSCQIGQRCCRKTLLQSCTGQRMAPLGACWGP